MDPHSENYYACSPYVYVGNNPMNLIDPNGKDWVYRVVDGVHEIYYDRSVRSQDDVNVKYGSDGGVTHLATGATATISQNGEVTSQYTFSNDPNDTNQYGTVLDQNGNLMADNQIISGSGYHIFGTSDDSVNAETLHRNLFGSNYIGPNNPKKYVGDDSGDDSYQFMPQSYNDAIAYMHDLGYDSKQAKGAAALFGANVYSEDRLLTLQARFGMFVGSPRDRFDAGLMYIGFGAISTVKGPVNGIQGLAGYNVPFILASMILFKQQHPLP
ncbi:hypothetical protein [Dysgonomonas sp. GY617]|uniref:hypothetical protein n=1 Tax=Dysgonomonas sp. GY617 TaxID=2780420 RepID=UPI001883A977|nr:hypothetical protein [Dysgonomonas sp. GY617]MBF0575448.1 hypothetical protein [Dysgonomonas sp. GY617]